MRKVELTRLTGVQQAQSDRLFHEFHDLAGRLGTTGRNDIHREVHSDRAGDSYGVTAARRELLQPASNQIPDACGDASEQSTVLLWPG